MNPAVNIADQMEALRLHFLDGLDDRLAKLDALREFLSDPDTSPRALEEIKREVHKLAGVAGSFSYEDLGQLAGSCEDMIQKHLSDGGIALPAIAEALDALLDEMDRILEA